MQQSRKKRDAALYLAVYTAVFTAAALIIYNEYIRYGHTLIGETDGFRQHIKALTYYSRWLKTIVKDFLAGRGLNVPAYTFGLGNGGDVMTTLAYYVVGDPFAALAAMVPERLITASFNFSIMLRMYAAGLSFAAFCLYRGRERAATLGASLIYVFCAYALHASVMHPYFLNPMVYLPLLLLGIDRFRRERKPLVFILSVFISAISNFYFFYMLVLICILYELAVGMPAGRRGAWRPFVREVLSLLLFGVIGTAMAGVILWPVFLVSVSDSRMAVRYAISLFYPFSSIRNMIRGFVTGEGAEAWTYLGYGSAALPAVALLFIRRGRRRLKALFVLSAAGLILPFAGHVMNVFSYPSNRWVFAFSMLVGYITAEMWPLLWTMKRREAALVGGAAAVWLLLLVLPYDLFTRKAFGPAAVMLLTLAAAAFLARRPGEGTSMRRLFDRTMLALVFAGVLAQGLAAHSIAFSGEINRTVSQEEMDRVALGLGTEAAGAATLAEREGLSFLRYTGAELPRNNSLLSGVSANQYYWTISHPGTDQLREDLCVTDVSNYAHVYNGFDDRSAIETLTAASVYVTETPIRHPYGFSEEVLKENGYTYLESKNPLPLGYTYDRWFGAEEYQKMSPLEKQEAMLRSAYVGGGEETALPREAPEVQLIRQDYEMAPGGPDLVVSDGALVATDREQRLTFTVEAQPGTETCLCIYGLKYRGFRETDLYGDDPEIDPDNRYTPEAWQAMSPLERAKKLAAEQDYAEPSSVLMRTGFYAGGGRLRQKYWYLYTPHYEWYGGREDFILNSDYSVAGVNEIVLELTQRGVYTYDRIEVVSVPMDGFDEAVSALKESALENVDLHTAPPAFSTNEVTGTIRADKEKLLCLAIPYSEGWSAFVDGKEEKLLNVNVMYMGLVLEPGEHELRLVYRTPGKRAGWLISLCGLLGLLAAARCFRRRSR